MICKFKKYIIHPIYKYMNQSKVALFANARNELHIKEWAAHHLLIGFDNIVIFDHKSSISLKKIFTNFDKRVKSINCHFLKNPIKMGLMNYALHIAKQIQVEWIIYLDCDEFLFLNKQLGVKQLLGRFPHADSVSINWLIFGSNNFVKDPDGLIIDNYIKSEEMLDPHVKTFVRLKQALGSVNPHYYDIKNKSRMYNVTNNQMILPYYFYPNQVPYASVLAYIGHYINQSEETYIRRKMLLPKDDTGTIRQLDNLQSIHNIGNKVVNLFPKTKYSDNIKRFLKQFEENETGEK